MRWLWYLGFAAALTVSLELLFFALMVLTTQLLHVFGATSGKGESIFLATLYGCYASGLVAAVLLCWRTRPMTERTAPPYGLSILVALGLAASLGLHLWFADTNDLFSSAYFPVPFASWLFLIYGFQLLPNNRFERSRGKANAKSINAAARRST